MAFHRLLTITKKYSPVINVMMVVLNFLVLLSGGGFLAWEEWYKFKAPEDGYTLRQSKVEADAAEQKPTDDDADMDVTELERYDDGSRLYDVKFNISSKNLSKLQISLSYSIAELYVGDAIVTTLKLGDAMTLNFPPNP